MVKERLKADRLRVSHSLGQLQMFGTTQYGSVALTNVSGPVG
jgi:hypothetical protein